MTKHTHHATHPDIVKRLKRANGHLLSVIGMIEAERPCTDIALTGSSDSPVAAEFKAITKYL
ncbi:MAG TPA: hypothetical protein DF966_16000 [Sulfitobacter sp.]|nr:hypothetical protein [Sulfitobacter sp.]